MQCLVTGGSGFIGDHLVQQLSPEHDVTVLDMEPTEREAVQYIAGDIRDKSTISAAMQAKDVVYHLAALVSVGESVENPVRSRQINVDGTMNVLEAARTTGTRVVLASSAAIYGRPEALPISEALAKEPTSPYGLEKLACDHYARLYHDLYGLETVALRYFNVYGPGQVSGDYSGVISIFIERALAGEDLIVHGDGEQTRDFVFVGDVATATQAAGTTSGTGIGYNIGTGEAITIRKLAEVIQSITDTDSSIVHEDPRPGDIEHSTADISRARADLPFEPTVSLREGLERTVEWYRKAK